MIVLYNLPLRGDQGRDDLGMSRAEGVLARLDRCYHLWREVWLPTLTELDGTTNLMSDAFSRQDSCSLIEIGGEPAGLCCFRNVDLSSRWTLDDSWFAPWPKELLRRYSETHRHALVPSWLTVAPAFRKTAGYRGPNLTGLLCELISLHVVETGAAIGFGTPRKDRSVHQWIERAGATCVVPDVVHHGVLVDLVAFYPENLRNMTFSADVRSLWARRRDLRPVDSIRRSERLNFNEGTTDGNLF